MDEGTAAVGYPENVPSLSQCMLLDWTHTFSARALNQLRLSYSRLNVQFGGNGVRNGATHRRVGNALATVSFSDPSLVGFGAANNFPQGRIVNTYQVQDNFDYTVGRHQLKAGVNFTYQRSPNTFCRTLTALTHLPTGIPSRRILPA